MLAESGIRKSDGARRLNRYLTDDQISAFHGIPPVGSDPGQLLAAQESLAREYLARGRRLYNRLNRPWPTEMDSAVRALWRRELRIDLS